MDPRNRLCLHFEGLGSSRGQLLAISFSLDFSFETLCISCKINYLENETISSKLILFSFLLVGLEKRNSRPLSKDEEETRCTSSWTTKGPWSGPDVTTRCQMLMACNLSNQCQWVPQHSVTEIVDKVLQHFCLAINN